MLLGFGVVILLVLLIGVPAVSRVVAGKIDNFTAFALGMSTIVIGTVCRFVLWTRGKAKNADVRLLVLGIIILTCTVFIAVKQYLH